MDVLTLGLSVAGMTVVPLGKKMYSDSKRLALLEANYSFVNEKLADLKHGQKEQSDKLDRLIERFL